MKYYLKRVHFIKTKTVNMRLKETLWGTIVLFFIITNTSASELQAKTDMKKLVNYNRMLTKHHKEYINQRLAEYKSWKVNNIPVNFRIPVEIESFRPSNSVRYYVIYNPENKTGVGYVPSNLAQLYEEEAWFAYRKYGKDAPSLSIVLAQQFTESAFNPWAMGDNNMSTGLPQLYRNTAKYLYKTDRKTWSKFFYFDKYGKHHFVSVRAMVKFPFEFLPRVKKYSFDKKFEGIRRYNGTGENAVKYAEKVMARSLFYEQLFASYNKIPLDTAGFKNNLFDIINLTLVLRENNPIDNDLMEDIFQNVLAFFSSGYVHNTYIQYYSIPVAENEPLLASQQTDYIIPVDGKDYYLIVEDGKVIYQYFNDSQILLNVLSHPKNKDYFLYYKSKGKIIKIRTLKQAGRHQIYSNVKPGDKVFVPPGTVLISPETNLAVRIN